ncbi:MAG: class I tRNA ligase family protein, partial [Clostridia bacterium]|nr:class I tRNA ligase family protein [Clostridia bacterium]
HLGQTPFDTVLIHGLVRDAQGRKMSKSLGNGIDPVEVIDQYGTDSLRFSLINGACPGMDIRISYEKIEAGRNFCNKIWNAARFVLMNLGDEETFAPGTLPETLTLEDQWILTCYNNCVKEVTEALEKYELGLAIGKLYDFTWDYFCDWYIELTKERLYNGGEPAKQATQVLCYVLSNTLKLMHPFLPFITEEIWQSLPHEGETIMLSKWPTFDKAIDFTKEAADVEQVMDAVRAIRNRRAEMNVAPSRRTKVYVESERFDLFKECERFFMRLASCTGIEAGASDGVSIVTDAARITIPMAELVDLAAERARLNKELASAEKDMAGINAKLSNPGFLAKAPANVVAEQRDRLEKLTAKVAGIRETLAALQ